MVGKEVEIDQQGEQGGLPNVGIAGVAKFEDAPNPRDITADCAIHEARKQGNAADAKEVFFWIAPRPDMGFEDFHGCANEMKNQYHFDFVRVFQFERYHHDLNYNRPDHQKIISRKNEIVWP